MLFLNVIEKIISEKITQLNEWWKPTRWNRSQTDAESMITSITTITKHHQIFSVRQAAYRASLAFHALPIVSFYHRYQLIRHFQA